MCFSLNFSNSIFNFLLNLPKSNQKLLKKNSSLVQFKSTKIDLQSLVFIYLINWLSLSRSINWYHRSFVPVAQLSWLPTSIPLNPPLKKKKNPKLLVNANYHYCLYNPTAITTSHYNQWLTRHYRPNSSPTLPLIVTCNHRKSPKTEAHYH